MPTSNTPQVAINDIGTAEDFLAAVDATIKYFNCLLYTSDAADD